MDVVATSDDLPPLSLTSPHLPLTTPLALPIHLMGVHVTTFPLHPLFLPCCLSPLLLPPSQLMDVRATSDELPPLSLTSPAAYHPFASPHTPEKHVCHRCYKPLILNHASPVARHPLCLPSPPTHS